MSSSNDDAEPDGGGSEVTITTEHPPDFVPSIGCEGMLEVRSVPRCLQRPSYQTHQDIQPNELPLSRESSYIHGTYTIV